MKKAGTQVGVDTHRYFKQDNKWRNKHRAKWNLCAFCEHSNSIWLFALEKYRRKINSQNENWWKNFETVKNETFGMCPKK